MPRKARANYFNFSGGLDTDNSPLNRSPVVMTDVDNCKIDIDGSIESRRGMELFSDTLDTGSSETSQYPYDAKELEIADPGTPGTTERFQAVIIGETLKLYDGDVTEMDGTPNSTINIAVPTSGLGNNDGSWVGYGGIPWDGKYIFTGTYTTRPLPDLDFPTKIEYTTYGGSTWAKTAVNAEFRKEITVSAAEPTTLTYQASANNLGVHPYHENQTVWSSGSYSGVPDYSFGTSYVTNDQVQIEKGVIRLTSAAVVDLTADAGDVNLVGVLERGMPVKINKPSGDLYDTVNEVYYDGSTYYYLILDNLSDTEGMTGITVYETRKIVEAGPHVIAPALGRLFMTTTLNPNRLHFSQVYTDDITNIAKFYTEANPVHPVDNEVVASDGGYIDVKGISNIRRIEEVNGSILLFADNGVWECVGSDGLFRADDFVVRQVSNKGIVGRYAATKMEDGIVYISKDGVNYVVKDPQSGTLMNIQSLTDNKIQNTITDVAYNLKSAMRVKYNEVDKELYVLYNDVEPDYTTASIVEKTPCLYKNILIFKLRLGAWYKFSLSTDTAYTKISIQDIFVAKYDNGSTLEEVPIVVYAIQDGTSPFTQSAGYGRLYTTDECDFDGSTHQEYNIATFSSAHQTHGDLMKGKNVNYIKILYEDIGTTTTDNNGYDIPRGGCKLRGSIDFANDPVETTDAFGQPFNSNVAYGRQYEVYYSDKDGFSHHMYKHKLLGRGNVLQYHFSNYLIERWWVAAQNSTGQSPVLDTAGTYWTETTEAAYTADGGQGEWATGTAYTTGQYVKTTKINHFKIIGWSCELIPTEGVTNY